MEGRSTRRGRSFLEVSENLSAILDLCASSVVCFSSRRIRGRESCHGANMGSSVRLYDQIIFSNIVTALKRDPLRYCPRYLASEKEWRKRQRSAVKVRAEHELTFIKRAVAGLHERDEVVHRREHRRANLLTLYGNRANMSFSNSCGSLL